MPVGRPEVQLGDPFNFNYSWTPTDTSLLGSTGGGNQWDPGYSTFGNWGLGYNPDPFDFTYSWNPVGGGGGGGDVGPIPINMDPNVIGSGAWDPNAPSVGEGKTEITGDPRDPNHGIINPNVQGGGQWGVPTPIPLPVDPLTALGITILLNRGEIENIFNPGTPDPEELAKNVGGIIVNPIGEIQKTGENLLGPIGNIMGPSAPVAGPVQGVGTPGTPGVMGPDPSAGQGDSSQNPVIVAPVALGGSSGGGSGADNVNKPVNPMVIPSTGGPRPPDEEHSDSAVAPVPQNVQKPIPREDQVPVPPVVPVQPPVQPPAGPGETPPPGSVVVPTPPPTTPPPTTPPPAPPGGGPGTIVTPMPTTITPTKGNLAVRNFFDEGAESTNAFNKINPTTGQALSADILGLYKDIYNTFTPQTLTDYASSASSALTYDQAALARAQQGILSPEQARNAQQGAREAWAARGLVNSNGAIGAEILNREAVRQQMEDRARAQYQQSMNNVSSAVGMQTGNIFQPIGSLISNTFNPYGQYANDVYDYNANAYNAWQNSQANRDAATEAAKLGIQGEYAGALGSFLANDGLQNTQRGLANIFSWLGQKICWVAREVYGEDDPRWMEFREWLLLDAPGWLRRLYIKHGERFAAFLRRNPWLKPPIRAFMNSRIEKRRLAVLKEAY